jgi:TPR repeat protein
MRFLLILMFAVTLAFSARAGEADADATFRSGLSAFNEGSYSRALATWGPLAAAGDPRAQEGIGFMYYTGRGVARDSQQAATYFYRAANQGEPTSQLLLAMMHFRSDGVPKSAPLALMWAELAMESGQPEAYEVSGRIRESATEAERAEGQRLLLRWRAIFEKSHARK